MGHGEAETGRQTKIDEKRPDPDEKRHMADDKATGERRGDAATGTAECQVYNVYIRVF